MCLQRYLLMGMHPVRKQLTVNVIACYQDSATVFILQCSRCNCCKANTRNLPSVYVKIVLNFLSIMEIQISLWVDALNYQKCVVQELTSKSLASRQLQVLND